MSEKHDCNCNHEHDHDHEMDDTIILVDEDGSEHTFIFVDEVEIDNQVYAVLVSKEDPEGAGYVFRVEEDEDGEQILMDIEDEDEFQRVVAILDSEDID